MSISPSLALESQAVAEELYALLRAMEPARWRQEVEPSLRARLDALNARLQSLLDRSEPPPTLEAAAERRPEVDPRAVLRARWETVRGVLQEVSLPATGAADAERMRAQWERLRRELLPAYEAVAAALKVESVHVPSLRPSNLTRKAFHLASGIFVLILLQHILPPPWVVPVAGSCVALAWSMEISRRFSERANAWMMWLFGPVAHPHERYRVNSATWYTTALVILAAFTPQMAAALAVIVLGAADPAAAIVGRRFGRLTILNGRTLEGTLAFIVAGALASVVVLNLYWPSLSWLQMASIAAAAAAPGAVAELVSERVDDNLTIPLTVGASVTLALWWMGVAI